MFDRLISGGQASVRGQVHRIARRRHHRCGGLLVTDAHPAQFPTLAAVAFVEAGRVYFSVPQSSFAFTAISGLPGSTAIRRAKATELFLGRPASHCAAVLTALEGEAGELATRLPATTARCGSVPSGFVELYPLCGETRSAGEAQIH